ITKHCGASMLMYDPELEDTLAGIECKHRVTLGTATDGEIYLEGREPKPWATPDEDATGTINYTSGTTARPKGVQLTHRSLWLNATMFGWQTGVSDRDTYLWTLPMFHCNGWGMSYAITGMGGTHIVLRKVDGAEILPRLGRDSGRGVGRPWGCACASATRAESSPGRTSCSRGTGRTPKRPPKHSKADGSTPATAAHSTTSTT